VDPVLLARELVRIDTTNPPGGEERALLYLAQLLSAGGLEVALDTFGPGRGSLVARLNPGRGPALCLAGHVDTVPVGREPWAVDPFAGLVQDGRLHGRGASDMKGGVAAMCAAALTLAREGFDGALAVYVFGGEESGCEGSFHALADPALRGQPWAVVVAEPTRNRPLVGHKGALWLACETRGRTAHGSMPELGDNALYKLVDAVARVRALDLGPAHAHLGPPTLSVNTLQAGENVNSVPDRARATIDIRSVPGQDNAALTALVRAAAGEQAEVRALLDLPPVWTAPDHPWLARACAALAPLLDRPPGVETVQFFTDAAAFRHACPEVPMLILGPGDPAQAHRTDEWCATADIHAATAMYLALARDWGAAPD